MTAVLPRSTRWRRTRWTHPELFLVVVAAVAWLAVLALHLAAAPGHSMHDGATGHHHDAANSTMGQPVSYPGGLAAFCGAVALWGLMVTAMMLPTVLPEARSISLNGKWKRRRRGQTLFVVGYLTTWIAVGAVLIAAAGLIGSKATGPWAVSAALVIAAIWETTRWKRLALRACHRVPPLPADGLRADRACVRAGIRNGLWCTGSCAPMMAPMALAPHTVGLSLMVFLAAVVCAEKLVRKTVDHVRLIAMGLALAATIVAAGAVMG